MENNIVTSEKNKVSTIEKVVSFFFPLIGLILYLCMTDTREDPNEYIRFAGLGFITAVVLTCLSTCVGCVATLGAAASY
jgi:hypothetical protein